MVRFSRFVRAFRRRSLGPPKTTLRESSKTVDYSPTTAVATRCGNVGLPQELVDIIMYMLRDDLRALKACSLTCKAMFASARHLIHRTLHLTTRNIEIFLQEKVARDEGSGLPDGELRFLSYMSERGFLQYTRQVEIRMFPLFTPDILLPHFHHFRSLDRIHSLTIEHYDTSQWENHYESCFVHFYPTLKSLTLRQPMGDLRLIFRFALQFPNLENFCLEWLDHEWNTPDTTIPSVIDQFSPSRGHLRLVGVDRVESWGSLDLIQELGNGNNFKFQSVELQDSFGVQGQRILDVCASTIESLTITHRKSGFSESAVLRFTKVVGLRQLTLRTEFARLRDLDHTSFLISTITSPTFCQLVIEIGAIPYRLDRPSARSWGRWGEIDRFLEERFAKHGDFKLVFRTGLFNLNETFWMYAKEALPLLASRGCVYFEISPAIDRYHYW